MLYQIVSNVADKVELFIEDEMTVAEIRALVGEMIAPGGTENKTVRLTFQGHILDDDSAVWSSILSAFPLENNRSQKLFVYVSNGCKADTPSTEALRAALPSSSTSSEEDRAARAQARMMEPMIDAMVHNPAFLDMIIALQPDLQRMLRESPEVEHMMRDPDTLKSLMLSSVDPDQRRLMNRSIQLQLAQVSATPGGEQMLERYTNKFLQDREAGNTDSRETAVSSVAEALPDLTKEANKDALPNPWANSYGQATGFGFEGNNGMNANFMSGPMAANGGNGMPQMGSGGGNPFEPMPFGYPWMMQPPGGGGTNTGPPLTASAGVADAVRWDTQITVLKDMGFDDEALCIEALSVTGGDIDRAVSFIIDRLQANH